MNPEIAAAVARLTAAQARRQDANDAFWAADERASWILAGDAGFDPDASVSAWRAATGRPLVTFAGAAPRSVWVWMPEEDDTGAFSGTHTIERRGDTVQNPLAEMVEWLASEGFVVVMIDPGSPPEGHPRAPDVPHPFEAEHLANRAAAQEAQDAYDALRRTITPGDAMTPETRALLDRFRDASVRLSRAGDARSNQERMDLWRAQAGLPLVTFLSRRRPTNARWLDWLGNPFPAPESHEVWIWVSDPTAPTLAPAPGEGFIVARGAPPARHPWHGPEVWDRETEDWSLGEPVKVTERMVQLDRNDARTVYQVAPHSAEDALAPDVPPPDAEITEALLEHERARVAFFERARLDDEAAIREGRARLAHANGSRPMIVFPAPDGAGYVGRPFPLTSYATYADARAAWALEAFDAEGRSYWYPDMVLTFQPPETP